MNITLLKYPTDEDWAFAKQCALVTIGKEMKTAPDMEWKHAILRARHSPIRTLRLFLRSDFKALHCLIACFLACLNS